ncbi:MAG: hypothetical protein N2589_03800, partial [bacterium]|nr:hypothetical protein [bacterium]
MEIKKIFIKPSQIIGNILVEGDGLFDNSKWYKTEEINTGLEYVFKKGLLKNFNWLTADILVDGKFMVVFLLKIFEKNKEFHLVFTTLNQCQARIRIPLKEVTSLDKWRFPREGAYLKPIVGGDKVDLDEVEKMSLIILRKSEEPARFCLTDFITTIEEVPKIKKPYLPKGFLVDEFGQSTLHIWKTKTESEKELVERLEKQLRDASIKKFPNEYSNWGGWRKLRFETKNFFRTHFDGKRWYLVDPDGYAFWSSGIDCVRPDVTANIKGIKNALKWLPKNRNFKVCFSYTSDGQLQFNFLISNFIRVFGSKWYE